MRSACNAVTYGLVTSATLLAAVMAPCSIAWLVLTLVVCLFEYIDDNRIESAALASRNAYAD